MKCLRSVIISLIAMFSITSCSSFFSGSTPIAVRPLDRKEIQKASAFANNAPLLTAAEPGETVYLYKVAFDGTMNDRQRVPLNERKTLVARIADTVNAVYYPGAGMQDKEISRRDAATGNSGIHVANQAAEDFFRQAEKWKTDDPHAVVRIFVTGFSRGAATARQFMNQVTNEWHNKLPQSVVSPHFYAIFYDTVATGQRNRLDLSIPVSLDYLVHFVAADEERNLLFTPTVEVVPEPEQLSTTELQAGFPQRLNIIHLPGAHSDIGAAYSEGIGDLYIVLTEKFLYMMGLMPGNCWNSTFDPLTNGKHDSRGLLDILFGAPDPDRVQKVSRQQMVAEVKPQSSQQRRDNLNRLQQMINANIDRGAMLDSSQIETVYASFVLSRDRTGIHVKDVSNSVEADTVFIDENKGLTKLHYKMKDAMAPSSLHLDNEILSALGSVSQTLSYTLLKTPRQAYLAIWLDNRLIEMLPVLEGKTITFGRLDHCKSQT